MVWCSAWPWLCPLLRVQICHGPQLVNYWEIYLHGSLMGLLGNNWACIYLWGSDISGLPGKLEELTEWMGEDRRRVRSVLTASASHKGQQHSRWTWLRENTPEHTFAVTVEGSFTYKTKVQFLSGRCCPCPLHLLAAMADTPTQAASSLFLSLRAFSKAMGAFPVQQHSSEMLEI